MIRIGIDVGGSTTKIVGFTEQGKLIAPVTVRATDPITSIYGALGRFTSENKIALDDIDKIMVTGVGSTFLSDELYGCKCIHENEFECVGRGGLYLSHLESSITVSIGTGTAIVYSERGGKCRYLGGTGVGGGTLVGLSKQMLGMNDLSHIVELAGDGELGNIDLRIADIARQDGKLGLPDNMTASNFGKLSDLATKADVALGIFNMVFETIGMMAIFAARGNGIKDIVITGYLSTIPQAGKVFETLNSMFDERFLIPELPQYATAIGAALAK